MRQRMGLPAAFAAALLLALLPARPAAAGVAPPDPIEDAGPAATADLDADGVAARLVRAGLPAAEAAALAASLTPEERAFLAARAENADVGGFHVVVGLLVLFLVVAGVVAIVLWLHDDHHHYHGHGHVHPGEARP